jgi:uncharacterized protein (TIGR04255 family)
MFMSLGGFSTNHVAKYRDSVKEDFPALQYQPRYVAQLEKLTDEFVAQAGMSMVGFGVQGSPMGQSAQRTWLVSADEQRLLQLQDDLFISNWRKRSDPYPRFESLLASFWDRFSVFRSEIEADMGMPLQLQQLEITYINWIPAESAPLSDWFLPARASHLQIDGVEVKPEHQIWAAPYLLSDRGVPVARMHVRQLEALRTTPGPHLGAQLELSVKAPLAPGVTEADVTRMALFARNAIVWAFTSLTTPEGHELWGQIT